MYQDPVPYGLWPTDLDGTNFGQHCPQFDRVTGQTTGSEDCLFLNIFTPFPSVSGKLQTCSPRHYVENQKVFLSIQNSAFTLAG